MIKEEQNYILIHEQTHIHRKDYIIKILAFLILSIHWFNPSAISMDADFSGITDGIAFISEVKQQTYISIDENGVEASALQTSLMPDQPCQRIMQK